MSDYPAATLTGALGALLFDAKAAPRSRWAFLVAVLGLKAHNLSEALRKLALRIEGRGHQ